MKSTESFGKIARRPHYSSREVRLISLEDFVESSLVACIGVLAIAAERAAFEASSVLGFLAKLLLVRD